MKRNSIIYCLTINDIQTVSNEEIGRDLSDIEIKLIEDKIAKKIDWYSAIADSIYESEEIVSPKAHSKP